MCVVDHSFKGNLCSDIVKIGQKLYYVVISRVFLKIVNHNIALLLSIYLVQQQGNNNHFSVQIFTVKIISSDV